MGEAKRRRYANIDHELDKIVVQGHINNDSGPNPFKSERIIEDDIYQDTISALTSLRNDVDMLNKEFHNSEFKTRVIAGDEIMTVDANGIRYGYKLIDLGVTMKRVILMKPINARFEEFNDEDRRKAIVPVFEVFLREGMNDININAKGGCIEITQEFALMFLVEMSQGPNRIRRMKS